MTQREKQQNLAHTCKFNVALIAPVTTSVRISPHQKVEDTAVLEADVVVPAGAHVFFYLSLFL